MGSLKPANLFDVKPDERRVVVWSAIWFFALLCANYMLRPARESLGVERGIDEVRWLFFCTLGVMVVINPPFAALVSRMRASTCVAVTYRFFMLNLLAFFTLLVLAPDRVGIVSGRVFYVWMSVFNLFAISLFWAYMADTFALDQSKRLYGLLAVGGTCGGVAGSWFVKEYADSIGPFLARLTESIGVTIDGERAGTPALMLCAVVLLEIGAQCAKRVARASRSAPTPDAPARDAPVGGKSLDGIGALARSSYLRGIGLYVMTFAIIGTLMYFTKLRIVESMGEGLDRRTSLFAAIDFWTQVATLVTQLLVTGRVLRYVGVPTALASLPAVIGVGFVGLVLAPTYTMITVLEAVSKAVRYALAKPGRETLFTVIGRDEKYKAKPLIDTFGYRFGDVVGAVLDFGLTGIAVIGAAAAGAVFVVPVSVGWAVLGIWLGREQGRRSSG